MSAIFISYRREDAEGHAGRLFEVLVGQFGKDSVFMDVAGIEPGRDFRKAIDANVAECGVLLAVIGKGWLAATDESGQRRIDSAHDFVRLETISALKRDIPVVPVLVHGAAMPRADQLPPEMTELAFRNGVELTHARWDSDVQVLIKALERYVRKPAAAQQPVIAPLKSAQSSAMKFMAIAVAAAAVAGGGVIGYQHYAAKPEVISAHDGKADQPAVAQTDAGKMAEQKEETARKAKEAADKLAAAQNEEAERKAKAERDTEARVAELRAEEEKIKQQTDALNAARVAAEKKIADAARLTKIEAEKKPSEVKVKPEITAQNTVAVDPPATHPSGLRSIPSTPPTTIVFINSGGRPVVVNWINFKGKEVEYSRLQPGSSYTQQTGVSHSWIVRDVGTQRQVATAVGAAEPTTVSIASGQ